MKYGLGKILQHQQAEGNPGIGEKVSSTDKKQV